jgi:hypothetical protein
LIDIRVVGPIHPVGRRADQNCNAGVVGDESYEHAIVKDR